MDTTQIKETLMVMMAIKAKYKKDREGKGVISCSCGGKVNYVVAPSNGHVWASCDSCSIRFIE